MSFKQEKMLLTGASGMLGRDLTIVLQKWGAQLLLSDSYAPEHDLSLFTLLDITKASAVENLVNDFRPAWIINCAAYTNVDQAEKNYADAFEVNSIGPANLAQAAKSCGASLLHVSTDYVYGGKSVLPEGRRPYGEEDNLAPCGIYGYSKRIGDELVRHILPERSLIVRTSWLHGLHGPNFLHTMLRLGRERSEIRVVDDQVGSPTWSFWLGQVMLQLIEKNARGLFNVSSHGDISWYDYACEVFRQAGIKVKVLPQSSSELGRPAPRPPYSTLDLSKVESFLGIRCPDWREDIEGHLQQLNVI